MLLIIGYGMNFYVHAVRYLDLMINAIKINFYVS